MRDFIMASFSAASFSLRAWFLALCSRSLARFCLWWSVGLMPLLRISLTLDPAAGFMASSTCELFVWWVERSPGWCDGAVLDAEAVFVGLRGRGRRGRRVSQRCDLRGRQLRANDGFAGGRGRTTPYRISSADPSLYPSAIGHDARVTVSVWTPRARLVVRVRRREICTRRGLAMLANFLSPLAFSCL